uniref:Uncharacterized protein n=1 Tax=Tanacetum cinerariifolium TaxID=118510 RepID=A0A6L2MYD5_TANCI|nr:hypothetical protein [Tanacetum cinerariifolium]
MRLIGYGTFMGKNNNRCSVIRQAVNTAGYIRYRTRHVFGSQLSGDLEQLGYTHRSDHYIEPIEFEIQEMIEQYFLMIDYSLWEVILNGDSPVPTIVVDGVVQPVAHRVSLSQEDVNLKFLRSLSSEWKTHTLKWRNKIDVDDLKEMDLRWQMAMLTMRARKRDILLGNVGLLRTEEGLVLLSHKKDCPKEESANFALMAITSSSSFSDNEINEKHGLGYFSSESDCESLSPSSLSDRSQPSGGYHVVPPPVTGTFMPLKPDMVFHTTPIDVETDHSTFTVQLSSSKPTQDFSHTNRPSAPIIEDLVFDSEDESETNDPQSVPSFIQRSEQALVVSAAKSKKGNWGNPQYALKDNGVIDSGCSRYMTGNMSYLSDFEELNGGYVAFGGNPKGGKISGKRKIKTGKLDFKDVYFVKELKFNLFSVSQMCNKKNRVLFTDTECLILTPDFKLPDESQVLLRVPRENNMYNVNLKNIVSSGDLTYLIEKATIDESNLWHRRLGHINFKIINNLVKGNVVRGLPTKFFEDNNTCVACKKVKQHRASCKTKPVSSIDQPLLRLHMDLFGSTFVKSMNKKSYCLVITDAYSRFTWVFFLATKDETSPIFKIFITGLENQLSLKQNGIAKRKNTTLIEAARSMLVDSLLPIPFRAEVVNTAYYVQNRVLVTKHHNKTPYELLHGRTPSIGFMRPFGCPVIILNTLDPLGKFEGKVDEGFLPNIACSGPTWLFDIDSLTRTMNYQPTTVGNQSNPVQYSGSLNPQNKDGDAAFDGKEHEVDTKKHESAVNVSLSRNRDLSAEFEDHSDSNSNDVNVAGSIVPTAGQNSPNSTNPVSAAGPSNTNASPTHRKSSFKDASQPPDNPDMLEIEDITYSNNLETSTTGSPIPTIRTHKDHPVSQIIGDLSSTTQTRSMIRVIKDQDPSWIEAMQEELLQFKMQKVWILVDLPHGKRAIGTKWVYRNKKDERGIVVDNKARLVA